MEEVDETLERRNREDSWWIPLFFLQSKERPRRCFSLTTFRWAVDTPCWAETESGPVPILTSRWILLGLEIAEILITACKDVVMTTLEMLAMTIRWRQTRYRRGWSAWSLPTSASRTPGPPRLPSTILAVAVLVNINRIWKHSIEFQYCRPTQLDDIFNFLEKERLGGPIRAAEIQIQISICN